MGGVFTRAGLTDVVVEAVPVVLRDATSLDNAMGLRTWARVAHERGLLGEAEAERGSGRSTTPSPAGTSSMRSASS